ncbi:MAG: mercury methylation corrinoid protein HgcA [Planctomycetaceae bacterium]|nr:mercury methylation corrinoid protein HgcA [Planctomycetaceae bacterium]
MNQSCCCKKTECCSGDVAKVPLVSTSLSFRDTLGAWKARWDIGRMNHRVEPGLYAVGKPDGDAPVLVSANYKLTFDTLRKNLSGLDCWLLILDTKGINVWCAAGKGTFGTGELVNCLEAVGLSKIVTHRKLILPQLGASGVSAHEVARRTGFTVTYGPVRASDIKTFLASGFQATREMREVKFTFYDRLVLTPVELVTAAKKSLLVFGVLFLLNLVAAKPFGLPDFTAYAGAVLAGAVFTPVLLPFIPGRAFSWKGWLLGLGWTVFALWLSGGFSPGTWLLAAGYLLLLPSVAAYIAMNFTGSSTYTSPSGVLKEMKIALPLIVGSSVAGILLTLIHKLI